MEEDGYDWWVRRVKHAFTLFDKVRIDHFRGFESYYAIPGGDETAKNGHWRPGPGIGFFRALEKRLGKLDIVAEDLGYLTEAVHQLVKDSGCPGMKLMQFAFDSRENSDYLPHRYDYHCVVYAGTHDNDTILGWMNTAPEADVAFARKYLRLTEEEGANWGMMKSVWATVGDLAIVTMQDLLGLGSEARMNTPSTASGNWMWRMLPGQASDELAQVIHENMELYRRLV
jgi:4-alpha-glucanotransferase